MSESTEPAVSLSGVCRSVRGVSLLEPLDWSIPQGAMAGLVGASGAGKTTTLRILLGALRPDAGDVQILGLPIARIARLRGLVAAALDRPALDPALTVRHNLRLHAVRFGVPKAGASAALDQLGLAHLERRRAGRLSRGEKQRVGLAMALTLRADLIVLDEPLAHLDPESADRVLELLRAETERGATVLVSSHHLPQIERSIDELAMLHRGRLLHSGRLDELLRAERGHLVEILARPANVAERVLRSHPRVENVTTSPGDGRFVVRLEGGPPAELNRALHEAGCEVERFAPAVATLDDLFRESTQRADRELDAEERA